MATIQNLMAFGMASPLARRMGQNPVITSAFGASAGDANPIAGNQYFIVVTATNTGSGLRLPQVGGQIGPATGAFLGDEFFIQNNLTASIAIYVANNSAGSAVTLYGNGVSAAGTTGISVPTGQSVIVKIAGLSTYVYMKSVASA